MQLRSVLLTGDATVGEVGMGSDKTVVHMHNRRRSIAIIGL